MFTDKLYVFLALSITLILGCDTNQATEDNPLANQNIPKALLATRFQSLDDFKSTVQIEYFNACDPADTCIESKVILHYQDAGKSIVSELSSGVSQREIAAAKDGDFWDKANLVWQTPYGIRSRIELSKIYTLARIRPDIFGYGDVAFYNLAEASLANIITPDLAFKSAQDSSEKGYINTFNHVTAQVLITALFSKEVADYIADVHELKSMPELTTGRFTDKQLRDTLNDPVDNYVDILNNEIGQEIGLRLKEKYSLSFKTIWTPELTASFLNDIQSFYIWSFGLAMKPYTQEDELILKFTHKINKVSQMVLVD
jgi:hypothetical protein